MCAVGQNQELESKQKDFLERDFCPQYDVKKREFESVSKWQKLFEMDAKLWLDSGEIEHIGQAWTREFLELDIGLDMIVDRSDWAYQEDVKDGLDHDAVWLDTLWDIDDTLVACVDALEQENIDRFTPNDLYDFFKKHRRADILVKWEPSHVETSYHEGKIPRLGNWSDALKSQQIGLDSLMNLAGLNSFKADQNATDQRVMNVTSQHK